MIENEYKILVDKNAFYNLLNYINANYKNANKKHIIQCNYYYDTKKFDLFNNFITYRIRQSENSLIRQIKIKNTDKKVQISKEIEQNITDFKTSYKPDNLPIKAKEDIHLLGTLITNRTRYIIHKKLHLDFDISMYFGITDYEIEIEYEKDIQPEAEKIYNVISKNIPDKKIKGKYFRFMQQYKKINNIKEILK